MSERAKCPECGAEYRGLTYKTASWPGGLRKWSCGTQEHVSGRLMRGVECYERQLAKYKSKSDGVDRLMELFQSFEGINTSDLSKADAYIKAWEKQRTELASQAAEIERLKARLAQADEKLVGILGVVNDAILDRQIMESIDTAASDAGGKE